MGRQQAVRRRRRQCRGVLSRCGGLLRGSQPRRCDRQRSVLFSEVHKAALGGDIPGAPCRTRGGVYLYAAGIYRSPRSSGVAAARAELVYRQRLLLAVQCAGVVLVGYGAVLLVVLADCLCGFQGFAERGDSCNGCDSRDICCRRVADYRPGNGQQVALRVSAAARARLRARSGAVSDY